MEPTVRIRRMRNLGFLVAITAVVGVGYQFSLASSPAKSGPPKVKYADVQKIFDASCIRCHGAGTRIAGAINLTNYEGVIKGGEDGPILVAGKPDTSLLYKAVSQAPGIRPMPPRGPKLAEKDIKAIYSWIKAGAKK